MSDEDELMRAAVHRAQFAARQQAERLRLLGLRGDPVAARAVHAAWARASVEEARLWLRTR